MCYSSPTAFYVFAKLIFISLLLMNHLTAIATSPTVIYNFTKSDSGWNPAATNSDGSFPQVGLVESSGMLYGVAMGGGQHGYGTLFRLRTNGTGFTTLRSFNLLEGAFPATRLELFGATLFGATAAGGQANGGTVFKVGTNGSGFNVLRHLNTSSDGQDVTAIVCSGDIIYGIAANGGTANCGTLFRLTMNGSGFTVLHTFTGTFSSPADGKTPVFLRLIGNQLYGGTTRGGINNDGTLFRINTDGSGYTLLKTFYEPVDGTSPAAMFATAGGMVGITSGGGQNSGGTLFMIPNGSGFSVISHLPREAAGTLPGVAFDGVSLYGTTANGSSGTLFRMNADGSGRAVLATFDDPSVLMPLGGVLMVSNQIFGTTMSGGTWNNGCVYRLSLVSLEPAALTLLPPLTANGRLVLRFTTLMNSNYSVERSTNVSSTSWTVFTNFVGTGGLAQVSVEMTNGPAMFFRALKR
jgi:uncharacterized repeat protein (TIGR03803 family)